MFEFQPRQCLLYKLRFLIRKGNMIHRKDQTL
jgi:hypothetical protein